MELRIEITKENKERIFKIINELLEEETTKPSFKIESKQPPSTRKYLSTPKEIEGLEYGTIMRYGNATDNQIQLVGTWGQFNSFFPVKAALRILANYLIANKADSVNLREFVFMCVEIFRSTKISNKPLRKYRGFPLRKKDTAIGRFVWHFLIPAQEMGLIKITKSSLDHKGIPYASNEWNRAYITITKNGLEFARLENPLFDGASMEQIFGEEERRWLIDFLKKIDKEGFREYSLLEDVYEYLKEGHNGKEELWEWFENDSRFINYVESWSRKRGRPEQLRKQIANLARTFSASKIALLRELGVVKNKRNDYTIIRGLETKSAS